MKFNFFVRREWMFKAVFIYTLTTIFIATWVLLHGNPAFGAPLLCVYTFITFTALLIKPIKYLLFWLIPRRPYHWIGK